MKRRNALMALGALATGSGAVSTTAAIVNTVETTAEMSVIVDERLEIRAGQAFNDDGTVKSGYTDKYVKYSDNSSFFDDSSNGLDDVARSEIPVATVNRRDQNINEDVKIQTATSIENDESKYDKHRFRDILEVENYGGSTTDIGIAYDRDDDQYGSDVSVGATPGQDKLTDHTVKSVFRFQAKDSSGDLTRISPPESDNNDDPAGNGVSIAPGEIKQIDLQINLEPWGAFNVDPKEQIETVIGPPSFRGTADTVDMLDAITVLREP